MSNQTIADFSGSDIIDVRDVISRVEQLREERDSYGHPEEWNHKESDDSNELAALEALLKDLCGQGGDEQWEGDWYPVTLINESYFEQAMDSDMEEFGYIPKNLPSFLTITVDYDALKQDYSEVEFEGETYYYR